MFNLINAEFTNVKKMEKPNSRHFLDVTPIIGSKQSPC